MPTPILVRTVGVLCVAPLYAEPWTGWYRAVTCAYNPDNEETLIKFVDYGGYASVKADHLRQIRYTLVHAGDFVVHV